MININNYILEKLKINRNTKTLPSKGDFVLYVNLPGFSGKNLYVDLMKVISIYEDDPNKYYIKTISTDDLNEFEMGGLTINSNGYLERDDPKYIKVFIDGEKNIKKFIFELLKRWDKDTRHSHIVLYPWFDKHFPGMDPYFNGTEYDEIDAILDKLDD